MAAKRGGGNSRTIDGVDPRYVPNQVRLLTRRVTKTSGQVTVPVDFRKRWGLSGKEVYVADLGGMIVIIPPMVARQGLPGEAKLREIADSLALGMNNNGN